MTETHKRLCWNCKTTNEHTSDTTPGVCCPRCGSQDTRRVRTDKAGRESAGRYLKNHCLASLPMTFEDVAELYHDAKIYSASTTQRLCMSHERLRAELSGAEILIDEIKAEVDALKAEVERRDQ